MADSRFASLLRDSFAALRTERPAIYSELCAVLRSHHVRLEVDGEAVGVSFTREGVRVGDVADGVDIEVRTTRQTIVEMVDAKWTLTEAILEDRLWLGGKVDDLIAFHDGLIVYLHGAVRSPSFPGLLRRLRGEAATGGASRQESGPALV